MGVVMLRLHFLPVLWSSIQILNVRCPIKVFLSYVTDAEIRSPAWTGKPFTVAYSADPYWRPESHVNQSGPLVGSWYTAVYPNRQSEFVPICGSHEFLTVPHIPTHTAVRARLPLVQLTLGTLQVAVTLVT